MADLHQLDTILVGHERALAAIRENLVELDAEPTVSLLKATAFTGRTAQRVKEALDGIAHLWQLLPTYGDAVANCRKCRDEVGFFRQGRVDELEALLTEKNISIAGTPIRVLLRQLNQSSQNVRTLSLLELQAEMTSIFADSAKGISEIDGAWTGLVPRTSAANEQAEHHTQLANELRVSSDSDIISLQLLRTQVMTLVGTDPLDAAMKLQELERLITRVERRLLPLVLKRDGVSQRIHSAHASLNRLRETVGEGATALAETRAKILCSPSDLLEPLDPALIDRQPNGLAPWLQALQVTHDEGDWVSASAGLERWESLLRQWEASADRIVTANELPRAKRDELRGLLISLKAKVLDVGRIEESALSKLEAGAFAALDSVPCDLGRADQLVNAYLGAIRMAQRSGGNSGGNKSGPNAGPNATGTVGTFGA